ncbi:MAG: hypothetical protein U9N83_00935 [Thermodesulfobacteriota bacterium]|nr:hypothetical protein [Thermodesulfobacteriota bacterium]
MKYPAYTRHLATILFIGIFLFSSCSSITSRIPEKPGDLKALSEARELISYLKNQNLHLKTFKGVGRITFWENEKKDLTTRVAWVGSVPDRLRIALRSVTGQPVVSFASDGQWLYLVNHTRGKFYKQRSRNSTMKRFFSIPVKSDDIVNILAGRVSVINFDSAVVIKNSPPGGRPNVTSNRHTALSSQEKPCAHEDGYILVLKRGWGNICQKIYLDANRKQVRKVENFYFDGDLKYRTEFKKMQDIEGYRVPSRLVLSTHDGFGFQLDIDRYWTGVSVSPSLFVLPPPK